MMAILLVLFYFCVLRFTKQHPILSTQGLIFYASPHPLLPSPSYLLPFLLLLPAPSVPHKIPPSSWSSVVLPHDHLNFSPPLSLHLPFSLSCWLTISSATIPTHSFLHSLAATWRRWRSCCGHLQRRVIVSQN